MKKPSLQSALLPTLSVSAALALAPACGASSSDEDTGEDAGYIVLDGGDHGDASLPDHQDASLPEEDDGGSADAGTGGDQTGVKVDYGFPAPQISRTSVEDSDIGQASLKVVGQDDQGLRTYQLSSTANIRQPMDGGSLLPNPRTFAERASDSRIRTGNDLFDSLYALAMAEAEENRVGTISDGSFSNGQGVSCGSGGDSAGCFETGRNWHYVWTRDTSFAMHLGLASVNPLAARNSMEFKLSAPRDSSGGSSSLEIVQDTGTGGSWPVSTDRVSWALGAMETLSWMAKDAPERRELASRALEALTATFRRDDAFAFDREDGLYFGETSFLDWRQQTYGEWAAGDPSQIAMSKSLSTNLLHMRAREIAAGLAEEASDASLAATLRSGANALREAIRKKFRLADGRWSSFTASPLAGSMAVERFDALATAFAVLFGVTQGDEALSAIATYPLAGRGVPVIWPQQQNTPIYHNRAHWPFVTGYWVQAAAMAGSSRATDFGILSLIRDAALNLSNMENYELMTGLSWLDDSDARMSGPVVNSQRQLWSVGGYLGMVRKVLFGIDAQGGRLAIDPRISETVRHGLFSDSDRLELKNLIWKGHAIDVTIHLPPAAKEGTIQGGFYGIGSLAIDGGAPRTPDAKGVYIIGEEDLATSGTTSIRIDLAATAAPPAPMTYHPVQEINGAGGWRRLFGPRTPSIPDMGVVLKGGHPSLTFSSEEQDKSAITYRIYRDGVLVADNLGGEETSWTDTQSDGSLACCYSVQSVFRDGGNASQLSLPVCYWGEWGAPGWKIQEFRPSQFQFTGGGISQEHGREHLGNSWGAPGDEICISVTAQEGGTHFIQAVYANGSCDESTGVTCGVKQVRLEDAQGQILATGALAMPAPSRLNDWDTWRDSTLFQVTMEKGRTYRVCIGGNGVDGLPQAVNMSAFSHFGTYTGNDGNGGTRGAMNYQNIALIKVLAKGR